MAVYALYRQLLIEYYYYNVMKVKVHSVPQEDHTPTALSP